MPDVIRTVLCVNAGSATLKCAVYDIEPAHGPQLRHRSQHDAGPDAVGIVLDGLESPPDVVAHRIVHGGPRLTEHAVIDDDVLGQLRAAISFAPLHLPSEIEAIESMARLRDDLVQVACLDTAFHRSMPEVARRLPLPIGLHRAGIRRYGFHGLSCEFVVEDVGAEQLGLAVIAHLGGGASVTAIADGRSIDTSMGLTPAGGVISATRTGDLDPGVLVHLLRHNRMHAKTLEELVTRKGGLLGISGSSDDMKQLLDRRDDDPPDNDAALAVDAFCISVAKQIAAMSTVLGGLDTIVFTGGIGENSPVVRASISSRLAHLGLTLDAAANEDGTDVISAPSSKLVARLVHTDENLVMARHAARLVPA